MPKMDSVGKIEPRLVEVTVQECDVGSKWRIKFVPNMNFFSGIFLFFFQVAYFALLLKALMCGKLNPLGPPVGTIHIINISINYHDYCVNFRKLLTTTFYRTHCRWWGDGRPCYIRHNAAYLSPYSNMVRWTGMQYGFPLPLRWCARHEERSAKFHDNDTSAKRRLYGMTFAEFLH